MSCFRINFDDLCHSLEIQYQNYHEVYNIIWPPGDQLSSPSASSPQDLKYDHNGLGQQCMESQSLDIVINLTHRPLTELFNLNFKSLGAVCRYRAPNFKWLKMYVICQVYVPS